MSNRYLVKRYYLILLYFFCIRHSFCHSFEWLLIHHRSPNSCCNHSKFILPRIYVCSSDSWYGSSPANGSWVWKVLWRQWAILCIDEACQYMSDGKIKHFLLFFCSRMCSMSSEYLNSLIPPAAAICTGNETVIVTFSSVLKLEI